MKALNDKKRSVLMTSKQIRILKALVKRNTDGSALDVYQLIDCTAPGTTRGAMMCSLRHMFTHGLIEDGAKVIRNSRSRRTFEVTKLGADMIRPENLPTS